MNRSKRPASNEKSVTEIELTFENNKVSASWYYPELEPIICSLCGKECTEKCVNINPYCG